MDVYTDLTTEIFDWTEKDFIIHLAVLRRIFSTLVQSWRPSPPWQTMNFIWPTSGNGCLIPQKLCVTPFDRSRRTKRRVQIVADIPSLPPSFQVTYKYLAHQLSVSSNYAKQYARHAS